MALNNELRQKNGCGAAAGMAALDEPGHHAVFLLYAAVCWPIFHTRMGSRYTDLAVAHHPVFVFAVVSTRKAWRRNSVNRWAHWY